MTWGRAGLVRLGDRELSSGRSGRGSHLRGPHLQAPGDPLPLTSSSKLWPGPLPLPSGGPCGPPALLHLDWVEEGAGQETWAQGRQLPGSWGRGVGPYAQGGPCPLRPEDRGT